MLCHSLIMLLLITSPSVTSKCSCCCGGGYASLKYERWWRGRRGRRMWTSEPAVGVWGACTVWWDLHNHWYSIDYVGENDSPSNIHTHTHLWRRCVCGQCVCGGADCCCWTPPPKHSIPSPSLLFFCLFVCLVIYLFCLMVVRIPLRSLVFFYFNFKLPVLPLSAVKCVVVGVLSREICHPKSVNSQQPPPEFEAASVSESQHIKSVYQFIPQCCLTAL